MDLMTLRGCTMPRNGRWTSSGSRFRQLSAEGLVKHEAANRR